MKNYFRKLFEYNIWANRRVIATLESQFVRDEKILRIFGHILSAQIIWHGRFVNLPKSPLLLWGDYTLDQLKPIEKEGGTNWLTFIDQADHFDHVLKYHNYVGIYYETSFADLMTHLINHASYHRGQIAVLLREKGWEPINTDFVTYDRILSGQLKES